MNEEPVGKECVEQTLQELGRFYYWPNDGNLGDYIIAESTRQLFRRIGVEWRAYDPENPPQEREYALVYGGGGRFVPYWGGLELIQEHLTRPQVRRCVILPHSIYGVDDFVKALDERHTVFCRERKTLAYCRSLNACSRFILAHDVGVFIQLDKVVPLSALERPVAVEGEEAARQYALLVGGAAAYARFRVTKATVQSLLSHRKIAFFLREDGEKGVDIVSKWSYDLSGLWSGSCNENTCSGPLLMFMAELASYADVVVTDRLHVAIMAMHVGKEVYMLDNDYGKLSGVYDVSLKEHPKVHLLRSGEPWPEELQHAWDSLNAPEYTPAKYDIYVENKEIKGPLISVIVPVYNTAPWLRRCLDSICSQSYRNLEILCVNDGSTDDSAAILEEYAAKDTRIKVITQANAGLSAARNTALEHATGEWVTGVDSDDYLEPGVYEKVMSGGITDEVDMAFFGVAKVDEEGAPLPFAAFFDLPAAGVYEMNPALAASLNVCFWSKLWRRSLLEKHSLRFPGGLIHEDAALYYLAVPYVRNVAVCPVVGYDYVQRQGSSMNCGSMSDLNRALRYVPVLEYVSKEFRKRNLLHTPAREYLVKMFLRLSILRLRSKEKRLIVADLAPIIRRSGVYRDLERFLPVSGWKRLFLKRRPQSKVYRLFGLAVWEVRYSEEGQVIDSHCLVWNKKK